VLEATTASRLRRSRRVRGAVFCNRVARITTLCHAAAFAIAFRFGQCHVLASCSHGPGAAAMACSEQLIPIASADGLLPLRGRPDRTRQTASGAGRAGARCAGLDAAGGRRLKRPPQLALLPPVRRSVAREAVWADLEVQVGCHI